MFRRTRNLEAELRRERRDHDIAKRSHAYWHNTADRLKTERDDAVRDAEAQHERAEQLAAALELTQATLDAQRRRAEDAERALLRSNPHHPRCPDTATCVSNCDMAEKWLRSKQEQLHGAGMAFPTDDDEGPEVAA